MNRKININITFECNSNCIFCAANHEIMGQVGRLSLDDIDEIVSNLKLDNSDEIILSGGEPTMHPDFFDILDILTKTNCKISMLTNGRILSKTEFAKKLGNYKNIIKICVPIHGTEKTHNRVTRCEGSYIQTIDGINNLRLFLPNVILELKFVICKSNYLEIEEIQNYIIKMRPQEVLMSTLFQSEVANLNSQILKKEKLLEVINNAIDYLIDRKYKGDIFVYGIPLCMFDDEKLERILQSTVNGYYNQHEYEEYYFDYTRKEGTLIQDTTNLCSIHLCELHGVCTTGDFENFTMFKKEICPFI